MNVKTSMWSVMLAAAFSGPTSFAAGLEGSQVTISGYCCAAPTDAFRQTIPLTRVVDTGVEFPEGSITNIGLLQIFGSNVDVGAQTIEIVYTRAGRTGNGAFNGFVFDFAGIELPAIESASLNPASSFAVSQIDLGFDVDSVLFSASGVNIAVGSRVLIDVGLAAVPVPEPATYALLVGGLALLFGQRVRRSRTAA